MLKEYIAVSQEKEGFRRLFLDEQVAIYVWYRNKGNEVIGFQITYFQGKEQKAFTWLKDKGYFHNSIEDGENSRFKGTPILIQDGIFTYKEVYKYLEENMDEIDKDIEEFVLCKVRQYANGK